VLFASLARRIAELELAPVRVVDYEDGYTANALAGVKGVEVVTFRRGVPFVAPTDGTLVLQSALPYALWPELRLPPNCRLLFWHLFHYNLVNVLLPIAPFRTWQFRVPGIYRAVMRLALPGFRHRLREFVDLLVRTHGIVFYDRSTIRVSEELLGVRIDSPSILPLPTEPATAIRSTWSVRPNELDVCWLGRLADFKVPVLSMLLTRIDAYAAASGRAIRFHVIGDGPLRAEVEAHAATLRHTQVIFSGTLTGAALDTYILGRADAVAAMGTSALHAARLGVPVLLLDFSYHAVPRNYRLRWLYEHEPYDIGHEIGAGDLEHGSEDSLARCLTMLDQSYDSVAHECRSRVTQLHDLDAITNGLLDAAANTRLRAGDIDPRMFRRGALRRLRDARVRQ
jgi:hypothetical protein